MNSGASFVVFGRNQGFPAEISLVDLLAVNGGDGSVGFVLKGANEFDRIGWSVSDAGDVNSDGIDDVILGSPFVDPGLADRGGQSYVIFGSSQSFPAEFEVDSLLEASGGNGSAGFAINGAYPLDFVGTTVRSAGDMSGDGVDDLLLTAASADPGGREDAGESYVLLGSDQGFPAEFEIASLFAANGGDGSKGFATNDCAVNFGDLAFMKSTFFHGENPGPGPSGLPNDCA